MGEHAKNRRLPLASTLVPAGLVALGVGLWMFVDRSLLAVAGFGAFGPGILRELGLMDDLDEFQRRAWRRAGYHAYLVGGLAAVLIVSGIEWFDTMGEYPSGWILLILTLMWLTWLFSALLAYWGPRTTATRVLLTFGAFWGVFVLAHFIGDLDAVLSGEGLVGLAVGIGILAPFFVLAWTAGRRPRATGVALLAVSTVFAVVFGRPGGRGLASGLLTATLLILPLAACGIALLRETTEPEGA